MTKTNTKWKQGAKGMQMTTDKEYSCKGGYKGKGRGPVGSYIDNEAMEKDQRKRVKENN